MEAAEQVKQKIEQTDSSDFPTGYCQFDFLPKNFHFDSNDKITFFDFDFFGHGWLVNDIMTFWVHLTLDVFFNRMTQEAADKSLSVFVEAYREHRKISDAELALVPYLGLGFWLFYMGFHTTHDQFYPFIFQPAQLKMRVNVIKQLMERYWSKVT
jgi:Ser/Thr protein kinase RdoA (MazF antagonist)